MIETFEILPGITLRCFRDPRFKQGGLSIQFIRPMDATEAAMNALLPSVLLRGCRQAPDLRAITRKLDDLYGASVGELVRRVGDYQTTGLICGFIADRYALEGDAILAPMAEFLRQLLMEPVTEKGVFSEDYVESEKKNLISAIEAQRNNKRSYAAARLLRHMCKEDSFGIPRLGSVSGVKAITPENLWEHYKKVLQESPVELFYVGEAEPAQVAELVKPIFADRKAPPMPLPPQTTFHSCGGGRFEETMDVAQARLVMGWKTPICSRDPLFATMQVCNVIFGGGMTSKLFTNVRERMSLCYDVSSGFHGSKGILTATAGIDVSKEEITRQEILTQLAAIQKGDITEEELAAAKEALCSGLLGVHDSPGAIESYYAAGFLSGCHMTPEQYREKIRAVTAEAVSEAAKTLELDTVYFLKGVQ